MNKITLITLALIAVLYSCEEDTYERIDREDWTKLQVGDTLYFRSSAHVDTFLVRGITTGFNTSEKINHTEYLDIHYKKLNLNRDSSYNYNYRIYRTSHGATIQWVNIYNGPPTLGVIDTSLQICNISIMNAFVIPYNKTIMQDNISVESVYYCNRFGVFQYKQGNGETFTLDCNCLQNLADRVD